MTGTLVAAIKATGVPGIYFPNGATTLLERIAQVGADVYSIDWRLPLGEFVCGPTQALVAAIKATGVPVIYFPNGATTLLDRIAQVGADVYSIDWRLPLGQG